jgi:hypothetical protein
MKGDKPTEGQNQGEGDRISARKYNRDVREFIAEGRVEHAAHDAKEFLEREPEEAERAEREAKRGPGSRTRVSVEELVAKGRSVVGTVADRVGPVVQRAATKIRSRLRSHRSDR